MSWTTALGLAEQEAAARDADADADAGTTVTTAPGPARPGARLTKRNRTATAEAPDTADTADTADTPSTTATTATSDTDDVLTPAQLAKLPRPVHEPVSTGRSSQSRRQSGSGSSGGSSSRRRKSRRRLRKAAEAQKRLDIQGLRAVAVIAVVVNHMFNHPQGGFLGVDVFFVISGFLITGLMLRDEAGKGHISLLTFYRRRVKRLFPAALTVTTLTVITAYLLFSAGRARSILTDALAATGFVANWRFIATGTDYFESFGPISPLRHYWSLSVEEQFYVVWPITLIIAFALAHKLGMGRRKAVLVAGGTGVGLLTVASFAAAVVQTGSNPVVAYFSTLTRGWELGLGALLAIFGPLLKAPRAVLTTMSWVGLAAIGVSFFLVAEADVPFPGAVLPCLGAVLVIGAASGTVVGSNVVLTNVVMNYVGDISYSIYLVHFPVIIFALAVVPDPSAAQYLGLILLILGLSMASYHFIENPLRSRPWTFRLRRHQSHATAKKKRAGELRTSTAAVLTAGALVAALAVFVLAKPAQTETDLVANGLAAALASGSASAAPGAAAGATPGATATGSAAPGASSASVTPKGPATDALQKELRDALATTSWPDINPPFDSPSGEQNRGCPSGPLPPASDCTWGNPSATHTMYLVGDSTSAAYFGAFQVLIQNHPDWKMRLASGAGCPFADGDINEGDQNVHQPECAARKDAVVKEINEVKPDLMVFTTSKGSDRYISQLDPEIAKVRGAVKTMLVLPAAPHITDPNDCYTTISKPIDCVTPLPDDYQSWLKNEQALATKYDASFIDPTVWFCADGYCPSFVGTTPQHKDTTHITADYSAKIAPAVDEALVQFDLVS